MAIGSPTFAGGATSIIVSGGDKGLTAAEETTATSVDDDHTAHDVAEQFAPVYEDNTNGVAAGVDKPLATSTYAPSLATDFGVATKANVKASAGNVLAFSASNANAAARFFLLHNKASAPTAGDAPLYCFRVAAGATLIVGNEFFRGSGGAFSTGIGWSWSTTAATFTDSATANEHTLAIHYK